MPVRIDEGLGARQSLVTPGRQTAPMIQPRIITPPTTMTPRPIAPPAPAPRPPIAPRQITTIAPRPIPSATPPPTRTKPPPPPPTGKGPAPSPTPVYKTDTLVPGSSALAPPITIPGGETQVVFTPPDDTGNGGGSDPGADPVIDHGIPEGETPPPGADNVLYEDNYAPPEGRFDEDGEQELQEEAGPGVAVTGARSDMGGLLMVLGLAGGAYWFLTKIKK